MSADNHYLVWSTEHCAWWAPGHRGYVRDVAEAGRFPRHLALSICAAAMPGTAQRIGHLPEIPVRLVDAMSVIADAAQLTEQRQEDAERLENDDEQDVARRRWLRQP
jgi:hypothetical protein